jgi:hypothetical protein
MNNIIWGNLQNASDSNSTRSKGGVLANMPHESRRDANAFRQVIYSARDFIINYMSDDYRIGDDFDDIVSAESPFCRYDIRYYRQALEFDDAD